MKRFDRPAAARVATSSIILAVAACELPGASARAPCEPDGSCPAGEVCVAEVCVSEPSSCARAVTAGEAHTCAIRDDHTAWCWGRNLDGQLGDGTSEDRTSPVEVLATTKFTAISTGSHHTCAVADDHTAWCWGSNASGPLGDLADSLTPVQVATLGGVTAIGAGDAHSCAVLDSGAVKCWGANDMGQLGNGGRTLSRVPITVPALDGIQEISVWRDTVCAIGAAGVLSCWGSGRAGQLGEASVRDSPAVMAVPPVAHVAVGDDFWCAVTQGGEVYCAGSNAHGQLGVAQPGVEIPVQVPLPVAAAAITAGDHFACATEARDDRHDPPRVWCWGQNDDAELADGIALDHSAPTVTEYADAVAIDGGRLHLCALSAAGAITCSGYNGQGQLGDGERTTQGVPPPPIPELTGVTAVAAGARHTCAVAGGEVLCWGENAEGQLGDGTVSARVRPTPVPGIDGAIAVSVGRAHSCALLADHTAMCWGANQRGQLGSGLGDPRSPLPRPIRRDGAASIAQIALGGDHTCALLEGGEVECWGSNLNSEVGETTCIACGGPHRVVPLSAVLELALGDKHSCALTTDHKVMCWGASNSGERGDGTATTTGIPTRVGVPPIMNVDHIATYRDFTCAVTTDRGATCWGLARDGEMGDGTYEARLAPGNPVQLSGINRLAAGGSHACAITASGVACWGASYNGQGGPLGEAGYGSSNVPVMIPLAGATAIDLAAGEAHTCALLADHTVTCWGDDRAGQLGDGVRDKQARVAPRLPCP